LRRFYEELVKTQAVLSRKHLGFAALYPMRMVARLPIAATLRKEVIS
jgi:hypothetical protein